MMNKCCLALLIGLIVNNIMCAFSTQDICTLPTCTELSLSTWFYIILERPDAFHKLFQAYVGFYVVNTAFAKLLCKTSQAFRAAKVFRKMISFE